MLQVIRILLLLMYPLSAFRIHMKQIGYKYEHGGQTGQGQHIHQKYSEWYQEVKYDDD